MIECSFPEAEANWTTKRQAELWQKQFLATLNKLERLWAEMPSNLLAHVDDSQNMFRADELYKNGSGVSELKSVIEQLQCVGPIHGRQTVGQKAEKLDFMRELSGEFKIATGKWMRADVATITSVIYGVSVNPPDVVRATKGMATPGPSNTLMRILHSNEPKTPSQN